MVQTNYIAKEGLACICCTYALCLLQVPERKLKRIASSSCQLDARVGIGSLVLLISLTRLQAADKAMTCIKFWVLCVHCAFAGVTDALQPPAMLTKCS